MYFVFGYAAAMPVAGRIGLAVAVLLAGLLLTVLASRRKRELARAVAGADAGDEISIADSVRSAGNVSIDGVSAPSAQRTSVARRVFGLRGVRISNVKVGVRDEEAERP